MTRSPKVSRAPVTRNAPAGSTATLWNVGRVPAGTSIFWPDGQRPAAGPALVKIRPSVSMTARTSAARLRREFGGLARDRRTELFVG